MSSFQKLGEREVWMGLLAVGLSRELLREHPKQLDLVSSVDAHVRGIRLAVCTCS
jgi:hypothetical protein